MAINKVTTPPSQKEVIDKINEIIDNIGTVSFSSTCPTLTPSSGLVTWSITHNLGTTNVLAGLYDSSGNDVMRTVTVNSANAITVTWNSDTQITAGSYTILILGGGSPMSLTVDSSVTANSPNPVSSAAVYTVVGNIESLLSEI
jgi:hypothetical protein